MIRFPSAFADPGELSRLLYHTAVWSGGRNSNVWIRGSASLRTHVREISRSPSGMRVQELSRVLGRIPELGEPSTVLDPATASELFRACLAEVPALLELGVPRSEPVVFRTRLPGPADNSRRTMRQIRSAVHHLGGDFELLRSLFRTGDRSHSCLDASFHVWPPPPPDEDGKFLVRLVYREQTVPSVLQLDSSLAGYALLACWDLALRIREAEGILTSVPDLQTFVEDHLRI